MQYKYKIICIHFGYYSRVHNHVRNQKQKGVK